MSKYDVKIKHRFCEALDELPIVLIDLILQHLQCSNGYYWTTLNVTVYPLDRDMPVENKCIHVHIDDYNEDTQIMRVNVSNGDWIDIPVNGIEFCDESSDLLHLTPYQIYVLGNDHQFCYQSEYKLIWSEINGVQEYDPEYCTCCNAYPKRSTSECYFSKIKLIEFDRLRLKQLSFKDKICKHFIIQPIK